jgi:hypothetical protein
MLPSLRRLSHQLRLHPPQKGLTSVRVEEAVPVVSEAQASVKVEAQASVKVEAAAVVSGAQASARAVVANAAVLTTSRMMDSPKKYFVSTVRPRWSRAVDGLGSVQW